MDREAPHCATPDGMDAQSTGPGFRRTIGLFQATAINMTQMCGIGPFITIPIMVSIMGGPQALLGWMLGAVVAMADGLVWAELGSAMPGSGGTYIYLREAFQYRTGKLMPFLFIWTMMITIPLIMSTGVIGLVEYMKFLFPHMGWLTAHLVGLGVVVLLVFMLYRRVSSVGAITVVLWIVMLATVLMVIGASLSDFDPKLAFTYPQGSFARNFLLGLGPGLVIGLYDYMGYNTTAYMGAELRNPGRVMPWSIIISIAGMMLIYLALGTGILGVLPWQTVAHSTSIASLMVERRWGAIPADIATVLVMVTAFASIFTGLLGGSRVPYQAARDKVFFSSFGKLHPKYGFPHIALLVMGLVTAIGSFFDLTEVISMLVTASVIVQSAAQIVALTVLRRRQPTLERPYRQWLYPVPSIVAMAGWVYIYVSGTVASLVLSGAWIIAGVIAFAIWARHSHAWPFGPIEIEERYLDGDADTGAPVCQRPDLSA